MAGAVKTAGMARLIIRTTKPLRGTIMDGKRARGILIRIATNAAQNTEGGIGITIGIVTTVTTITIVDR